jgi:hypothetical protein
MRGSWSVYVETDQVRDRCGSDGRCPVIQMDMTGREIAVFESSIDASDATGVCDSGIRRALRGVYSMAGGFKWRRAR